MAYVVLALGVLMAAAGVDAIATGYPVIQVERGWATVISGSVMLTGGLVTVALGLAMRTLADIRAALRSQPGLAPAIPSVSPPIGLPQVMPQPTPAELLPAHDIVPALGSAAAATIALKAAEPPEQEARDPLQPDPLQDESPAPGPLEAPSLPSIEPAPRSAEPAHQASDAAKTDEPTPDGYELQSPSTAEHDIAQVEPPHAPRPTEDEDWLDRALSDFEAGLSPTHPAEVLAPEHVSNAAEDAAAIQAEVPAIRPEPAAAAPAEADSTLIEPAYAEEAHAAPVQDEPVQTGPSHAEPAQLAAEPQASPAHEPAPHDLAVIGRYESDGTSYVMYADGSIEAQSDAGVYRFRSMAELKAFIEG